MKIESINFQTFCAQHSPSLFEQSIFQKIFKYLSPPHLLNHVRLTSKKWKILAEDESLWFYFCRRQGWVKKNAHLSWMEWWKQVYSGRIFSCSCQEKIFDRCPFPVTGLGIDFPRIAFGGSGGKIMVYNIETAKTTIFQPHTNWITQILFKEHRVISSGFDRTIQIWDLTSGKPEATLTGHHETVYSLSSQGSLLASSSLDNEVRIWDLSSVKMIHSFSEGCFVNEVIIREGFLITSLRFQKGILKLRNIKSKQVLFTIWESYEISSLHFYQDLMLVGTLNKITIWSLEKMQQLVAIHVNEGFVTQLSLQGWILAYKASHGYTALCNLATREMISLFVENDSACKRLFLHNNLFITILNYQVTVREFLIPEK